MAVLSVSDGQSYVDIESQKKRVIGYFSRSVNKYYNVDQLEKF